MYTTYIYIHNAMYNIVYYGRRISRNRQNRIRRKCIITRRPEFLYNIYIIFCIKTDLGVQKNRTKTKGKNYKSGRCADFFLLFFSYYNFWFFPLVAIYKYYIIYDFDTRVCIYSIMYTRVRSYIMYYIFVIISKK